MSPAQSREPRAGSLGAPSEPASATRRLTSIDTLRGAVMVIMALDHVRDFFHVGAMSFQPEDLSRTTTALFLTRWITHICAPAFMFLAGMGACIRLQRTASRPQVSWFLVTRGLWLVLIELTVMRLAMNFTFSFQYPVIILVLSALGLSMVALAVLIYLPMPILAVLSIAIIGLHNLLDGVRGADFGAYAGIWRLLHEQGIFTLFGAVFFVAYPVLPWVGVMAAGFCFGKVFQLDAATRQRLLIRTGVAAVAAFLVLRAINVYGDPAPWSAQPSAVFTVLSFLRATKYPPSLAFILMTLGPVLIALAWLERRPLAQNHPLTVIGRVPFFYYVVHFWMIHIVCALFMLVRYGSASFPLLLSPVPSMGGSRQLFPADFGYPLWVVYVVWIGIVALLYPLCRWFDRVKSRKRAWWVSYV